MRSRATLLVVVILLIAGFAALNWSEVLRLAPLSFGLFVMDAPLGAILLGLLALATVAFALGGAAIRTQSLMESRQHFKTLEAQRALADKAEASRFTDLRQHLDVQLRELRERDAIAATEFQKAVVDSQRELRTQLEQINRTIAARMNEIEHRLDGRVGHHVAGPAPMLNPAPAQDLREAQGREEQLRQQRLRDERARADQVQQDIRGEERTTAVDRPAETGWRRWF
jgi:hypothetical protein